MSIYTKSRGYISYLDVYKSVKETFFASCLKACLMEWLPYDGKQFSIIIDGYVKLPNSTPDYINYWTDISETSDDAVIVKMYEDITNKKLIKEFRYKISDFICDYEKDKANVFSVFRRISDTFKNEYLKGVQCE